MRLEQTLVPRAEAGAGRTQVRWYPTHGYQREQPSRLLAPALPLHGGEADETLDPPVLPLLTAEVISTRPITVCRLDRDLSSSPRTACGRQYGAVGWLASMALNG